MDLPNKSRQKLLLWSIQWMNGVFSYKNELLTGSGYVPPFCVIICNAYMIRPNHQLQVITMDICILHHTPQSYGLGATSVLNFTPMLKVTRFYTLSFYIIIERLVKKEAGGRGRD